MLRNRSCNLVTASVLNRFVMLTMREVDLGEEVDILRKELAEVQADYQMPPTYRTASSSSGSLPHAYEDIMMASIDQSEFMKGRERKTRPIYCPDETKKND